MQYARILPLVTILTMIAAAPPPLIFAQAPGGFGVCVPASQRAGRTIGCFILAEQPMGALGPAPVYWHVTRFSSRARADAARRASRPAGTVLTAYGRAWLLTIADSAWRPPSGTPVASIGPIDVNEGVSYAALYMEASMTPGMKSAIHRHSGAEAWYTLSGETCLETPGGTHVGRAHGAPVIVPGGVPMELTATGTTVRRSLVLILHDASEAPTTMEREWKPKGLCRRYLK